MKRKQILTFGMMVILALAGITWSQRHHSDIVHGATVCGEKAQGVIPPSLPNKMLIGLMENQGQTWMKTSGVAWNARYCYLVNGWVNNWGWSQADGSFATGYMNECAAMNTIPVFQFYIMNSESGGGESAFYAKTQNPQTMKDYFTQYKTLLQRIKEFGKPVVVLLEADGFGLLQSQCKSNPTAYAAIADSGLPELASLPNTVAGWGLAFLQLRKALGAANATLGIHISGWASGQDIAYTSVTLPLQPEVDTIYKFLAPLGLGANSTGQTYDVLVGDPLDRDADYYRINYNSDRWWDASDSASIYSKSFNRYAEWLRLWNVKTQKRWVLWQIPIGNSNHLNVYNSGKPREGYKDNRAEYLLGEGSATHLAQWADCGVIGLLFGIGLDGQANYTNDVYTDGKLFIQSRAGALLNAGGITLSTSGTNPGTTPVASATPVAVVTPTPVPGTATPETTATATVTPSATPAVNTGKLKVQLYNINRTAFTSALYPYFRVVNLGSASLNLSNVTLRYYFTVDSPKTQNYYCDWAQCGSSNLKGAFIKMTTATATADHYLEIGFTEEAGTLNPGASTQFQLRIVKSDWSQYQQSNDYSFNANSSAFTDWNQVTAYYNQKLAWGIEP